MNLNIFWVIGGETLHKIFKLPVHSVFKEPSKGILENIRCELEAVKILIIDEYAMAGKYALDNIE